MSGFLKDHFNNKFHAENSLKHALSSYIIRVCFILMLVPFISVLLIACTTKKHPVGNEPYKSIDELYGYYEFSQNIFTNPLSSFLPFKGHMPFYEISESGLSIISIRDGSVQNIPGTFEKKSLGREQFKKMFTFDFSIPDIDKYESCYEYAVFSAEEGPEYRLYGMDQEIWLVNVHTKNFIWSIYGLCRTRNVKAGPDGQLIVPTEAPYVYQEGFQLEICSGKSVLNPVLVSDKKSRKALEELVQTYDTQTVRTDNADIFTIGDYFRFYDATGKDDTLYYVFLNQAIAEQPQMQTNKASLTRSPVSEESYEALYQLWEDLMPLPDKITVISGDQSISAFIFRQHDEVDLEGLKEHLPWLTIQSDEMDPFRVYLEGEELFGRYEAYDAETMEPLNFVHPSGLKPQTYLFQNAKPDQSCIIVLSSGYSTGTGSYGLKIIFGATLP